MVFRISVTLKEIVQAETLQDALDKVLNRFPYYRVRLRAGFFWYYLERNEARSFVQAESETPCHGLPDAGSAGHLFRVQAYKRRISVEFFHALTDGTGGLNFLKTLTAAYLERKGSHITDWGELLNPEDCPNPEEFEDAYHRYNSHSAPKPPRLRPAFRLSYPLRSDFRYSYITGECSATRLHSCAKNLDASVTEYIAGVYLFVLQQIYRDLPPHEKRRHNKALRLEIPVDMRRLYPSKSMRNFSLFVTPGIDMRLGLYTLEEIIQIVHNYMGVEVDARRLNRQLARNVNPEGNAFIRSIPLAVKSAILQSRFAHYGPTLFSGVLTNLGRITMPECLASQIESFTFVPSPGTALRIHGGVATYGDMMRITFGSVTDITELERRFFGILVQSGIHVKIYHDKEV
jgi:hypothetical protein